MQGLAAIKAADSNNTNLESIGYTICFRKNSKNVGF
jgi:hypothetical protein